MKRSTLILMTGLALGLAGYTVCYLSHTAPSRLGSDSTPELAWLKREYRLSDEVYTRLQQLHAAYLPQCAERCEQIDATNARLRQVLLEAKQMTPEVERLLGAAAELRQRCHTEMLRHFLEVSRTMPPEQGQRYLRWVLDRTITPAHSAMTVSGDASAAHEPHAH